MNDSFDLRMNQFYQILQTFLKTVGKNSGNIDNLLREFKNLRTEYLETLRDNVIPELVQSNRLPNAEKSLNPQQLVTLLAGVSASFRSEQQKSYQFLEHTLCEDLLTKIPQEAMEQGFTEVNELRHECRSLVTENDALKKSHFHLEKRVMELESKCGDLSEQLKSIQQQKNQLASQVNTLQEKELAVEDYEQLLSRIRKEVEGKNAYDSWRLKIMYNRIAAFTRSSWSLPGAPKPDAYIPKSNHAAKFLDSIKPD